MDGRGDVVRQVVVQSDAADKISPARFDGRSEWKGSPRLVRWAGGWRWIVPWVAFVLLGVLLRIPSLGEPMWHQDEGYFASIAFGVRSGGVLYGDHWDLKPPMIFWTYAGVQELFGTSVTAIHAVSIAALLAVYATTAYLARELGSPARAVVAAAVVTLLLADPVLEGNLALTENFLIVFTSLAACTWLVAMRAEPSLRRDLLFIITGLLFGIAANYKQVALWDAAAFGLMTLVLARHPWLPLARMAVAGVAVFVPFMIYAVATSSVSAYWEAMFGFLGPYAAEAPQPRFVLRYSRYVPLLAVAAWVVIRRLRGQRVPLAAIAPLWLAAAFTGSVSSTQAFVHYLMQCVPPLALTIALLPVRRSAFPSREWAIRGAVAAAVVIPGLWVVSLQFDGHIRERGEVFHDRYYGGFFGRHSGIYTQREYDFRIGGTAVTVDDISAEMTVHDEDPTLFVWGHLPWLYVASGHVNAGKHYSSFTAVVLPETLDEMQRRLEQMPPDYVVLSDEADLPFPWLEDRVARDYEQVAAENDWALYLRRDLAGE